MRSRLRVLSGHALSRQPKPHSAFDAAWADVNKRLEAVGEEGEGRGRGLGEGAAPERPHASHITASASWLLLLCLLLCCLFCCL